MNETTINDHFAQAKQMVDHDLTRVYDDRPHALEYARTHALIAIADELREVRIALEDLVNKGG